MPTALSPSRRRVLAGALLLVAVLVVAGRHALGAGGGPRDADAARVETLAAAPAVAEAPRLVVHVVGAVARPGLYRLAEGSRVADAVERAGGATEKAELAAVNLAAPLADGVQVLVPERGPPGAAAGAVSPAAPAGPVRLSTATVEQLDALPGVGPVTAQRIVDHRERHGPFASVDELDAVSGIGPARLEQLRELVAP